MNGKKIIVLLIGVVLICGACFGLFKFMTKDIDNNNLVDNPNSEIESGEKEIEKEFVIGEREAIFTERFVKKEK